MPWPVLLDGEVAEAVWSLASERVLLGLDDQGPVFAVDLPAGREWSDRQWAKVGEFIDLRRVGARLESSEAALLAYARGLLYWHRQQRYCGRCGGETVSEEGGITRLCRSTECGRRWFPRLDPAVIVLVEHRPEGGIPRCLLARHSRLPAGMFSTLAGFVEPGESLEEAVVREVKEETGVEVGSVAYQGSQPWPFPASLMVGFRARALTTRITLDDDELVEAHWFTADEVSEFGEWGDQGTGRKIPRHDSIARHLIESWAREVQEQQGPEEFSPGQRSSG
ncbi:MAG: hypothetical protein Kow006_18050 [Gammaproteobacteria bacterium]